MRKFVWLVAGSLAIPGSLAIHSPASADFVYDPEKNPIEYECDEDIDEAECARQTRFEAWWLEYGKRHEQWYIGLLYTTDAYFPNTVKPLPELTSDGFPPVPSLETRNLVDAIQMVAFRKFGGGWAFAIHSGGNLRMVRPKVREEYTKEAIEKYRNFLPTSQAEMAEELGATWSFDEANLSECEGAIAHLLDFPAQKGGSFWSNRELEWMPDYVPYDYDGKDELIVTMDGDGVFLRARSVEEHGRPVRLLSPGYIQYDQHNGGVGYEWAHEMREIVGPCLKPSQAIPPWEKFLAAQIEADAVEPAD